MPQKHGMREGPGDFVEDYYNAGRDYAVGKAWRGTQAVLASGFGKGLVLGALLVVAATMFTFGIGAYTGAFTNAMPGATAAVSLGEGLKIGFNVGLQALAHPFGIIAALGTAVMGAVAETRQHQAKLSAAEAARQAEQYAQARRQQPAIEKTPEQSTDTPEKSHVAAEMDRRARTAGAKQLRDGYGPG